MTDLTQSHRQAWEAIPWILNGSASESETRAAQEHLRLCADCREALAFERRLRDAMAQPQTQAGAVEEGWQSLCARLDSSAAGRKSWRVSGLMPARQHASRGLSVRWLAAAVVVEALALGAMVSTSWINRTERQSVGTYRTLSRPDPASAAPTIRVVLAPAMTLEQFRLLLTSAHLKVVSGPGEAGVWSLAPAEDATAVLTESALRQLRESPQVRFAEPIDSGTRAPGR
jgi:hypothetical protein